MAAQLAVQPNLRDFSEHWFGVEGAIDTCGLLGNNTSVDTVNVRWCKKKRNGVAQITDCATGPNSLRLMLRIDPILNRGNDIDMVSQSGIHSLVINNIIIPTLRSRINSGRLPDDAVEHADLFLVSAGLSIEPEHLLRLLRTNEIDGRKRITADHGSHQLETWECLASSDSINRLENLFVLPATDAAGLPTDNFNWINTPFILLN
ncbi:hypothetical protein C8J57DRAFT_1473162 [Mycena rebaudengoi]|nr:hypothetical protein C8J57DRAFT_1473162 [Mycena rebaudengoi]